MLPRRHALPCNSAFWALHREVKDRGRVALHNTRLVRSPLGLQKLGHGVVVVLTNAADVVEAESRMDAASAVNELAHCTAWLHTCDCSCLANTRLVRPLLVDLHSKFLKLF